jgi:predicted metalloprotease with PDZ domain
MPDRAVKPWLGISTRNDNGRLVVTQVQRNSPGETAGLNVDDEIVAIDDFRVRADRFDNRLEQYRPGDTMSILVARREQLLRIPVAAAAEPLRSWRLEDNTGATDVQRRTTDAWLKGQS